MEIYLTLICSPLKGKFNKIASTARYGRFFKPKQHRQPFLNFLTFFFTIALLVFKHFFNVVFSFKRF